MKEADAAVEGAFRFVEGKPEQLIEVRVNGTLLQAKSEGDQLLGAPQRGDIVDAGEDTLIALELESLG